MTEGIVERSFEYDDRSEVVRRVARAIDRLPYSATPIEQARAALLALREPTEGMVEAGAMAGRHLHPGLGSPPI